MGLIVASVLQHILCASVKCVFTYHLLKGGVSSSYDVGNNGRILNNEFKRIWKGAILNRYLT